MFGAFNNSFIEYCIHGMNLDCKRIYRRTRTTKNILGAKKFERLI